MVFSYTRQTLRGEYDFTYEPSNKELIHAIADIVVSNQNAKRLNYEEHKLATEITAKVIEDYGVYDSIAEDLREELTEYFETDALNSEGEEL